MSGKHQLLGNRCWKCNNSEQQDTANSITTWNRQKPVGLVARDEWVTFFLRLRPNSWDLPRSRKVRPDLLVFVLLYVLCYQNPVAISRDGLTSSRVPFTSSCSTQPSLSLQVTVFPSWQQEELFCSGNLLQYPSLSDDPMVFPTSAQGPPRHLKKKIIRRLLAPAKLY